MKRPIAILLGVALLASSGAVFARGGGRGGAAHAGGGGFHGGAASMGVRAGHPGGVIVGARAGHPIGRPFVGVRPGPAFIGRPPFFRHRVVVGGAVLLAAPLFFPYPYYPPAVYAPPPVYTEPPAYIEQGGGVYYYCPDFNDYYPNVPSCPSQWVPVSATAGETPGY
jgi:hypothetical protein